MFLLLFIIFAVVVVFLGLRKADGGKGFVNRGMGREEGFCKIKLWEVKRRVTGN